MFFTFQESDPGARYGERVSIYSGYHKNPAKNTPPYYAITPDADKGRIMFTEYNFPRFFIIEDAEKPDSRAFVGLNRRDICLLLILGLRGHL